MTELDLSGVSHGVVVRPGDTLLVVLPRSTPPEQLGEFKEQLAGMLPEGADCAVLAGVEQLAVYRPENPEG